MQKVKEQCSSIYDSVYIDVKRTLLEQARSKSRSATISKDICNKIETAAQKEAIKISTIESIRSFPTTEPSDIWRAIYEVHVNRKSGIDNAEIISKVISADQSWKKSSGHAFEEIIKTLGTQALEGTGIEIVLQRDLNALIKANQISNEPRDISWLKEQIKGNIFDLYAIITKSDGKKMCFGCIQSKTSIRDRVTRDREPSTHAMQSYFWSVAITLDGDFLRLPKFISMVNGGTTEYPTNGWHGMYVFSEQYNNGRIHPTNLDFKNFKEHAIQAAKFWLTQRQWFDSDWSVM